MLRYEEGFEHLRRLCYMVSRYIQCMPTKPNEYFSRLFNECKPVDIRIYHCHSRKQIKRLCFVLFSAQSCSAVRFVTCNDGDEAKIANG